MKIASRTGKGGLTDLENKLAVTSGERGEGRISKGRGKSGYYRII